MRLLADFGTMIPVLSAVLILFAIALVWIDAVICRRIRAAEIDARANLIEADLIRAEARRQVQLAHEELRAVREVQASAAADFERTQQLYMRVAMIEADALAQQTEGMN